MEHIDFNGIEAVQLSLLNGSSALVSRLGGQLLSWKTAEGIERMFLSNKAVFDGSRSIRGGIPVCFPQFSELGSLPKHGLVRTRLWNIDTHRGDKDYALLCLSVEDNEASRLAWPHRFRLELTVALENNRLDVELAVENRGETAFEFTAALHSYLRVREVEQVYLRGLQGMKYRDAAAGDLIRRENDEEVTVEGLMDRVYHDVHRPLLMADRTNTLAIHQEGFPDIVVWNPWELHTLTLPDMEASDFRRMLCVEAAVARIPRRLAAGASWVGRQSFAAL